MSLNVIKGSFDSAPQWSPACVTFVSTKKGLRQLGEPRVYGSFAEQAAAWVLERTVGGRPQYWQVDITKRAHPEVQIEQSCRSGVLKFDIRLNFDVRVIDAKKVLEENIRSLDGYFNNFFSRKIARFADARDISESQLLRRDIDSHFGGGREIKDRLVEASNLSAQVQPADKEALNHMRDVALALAKQRAIEARVIVTKAEMRAFNELTGGMTIEGLARAAITTGNPHLLEAYQNLSKLKLEEEERNFARLKFLLDNNLVEAHDLEKHLGPLGDQIMKALTGQTGGPTPIQKRISNS